MHVQIMGIVNVTPDSFYAPSRSLCPKSAIAHALKLQEAGADLLDIGATSTRPGALPTPPEEEWRRLEPVLQGLRGKCRLPLSIDTYHASVAARALAMGATMINDITGLQCPALRALIAKTKARVCIMHMQNTPQTMQNAPHYPKGVTEEVAAFLQTRCSQALQAGIARDKIYLDPGIGFGKTVEDNLNLLRDLPVLSALGYPLLLGVSRKSFMSKILNTNTSDLLSTTIAVNTMAILSGADITLRVHDVQEHRQAVDLLSRIQCS
jgi:dihydropteroate synthase